jgi:hypothetical protein
MSSLEVGFVLVSSLSDGIIIEDGSEVGSLDKLLFVL